MEQTTNTMGQRPRLLAAMVFSLLSLGVTEQAKSDYLPSLPTLTPCDGGFLVGARCVLSANLSEVEKEPQPTDPGNFFYNFDKTYANMGALKKNEPMIEPNADLGAFYMYNGNFVRIGVSYKSFVATGGGVKPAEQLPYRQGDNKRLPYNLNAVKAADGTKLAAPNCTVCHSSVFQGKLVEGLGRSNHFIGTDASGFTLNVLGIGINSVLMGDTFAQLNHGIGLLVRLFQDAATHDHLFDLFAALGMRHDANTLKWTGRLDGNPNSGMKGWIDFPAWWHVKKKNALYATGSGRGYKADHMLYMSWFSVDGIPEAETIQNNFMHVQKWIEDDVKPPKFTDFGGKVNQGLADTGKQVFEKTCAGCHGTYSADHTQDTYPNVLVDLAEVGTDPYLATNNWIYPVKSWYDRSWYGKRGTSHIEKAHGYMAPPLDGVWITAPYFHNGSVPTLEAVLDSSKRPKVWTSQELDKDYDWNAVGWMNKPGEAQPFILTLASRFGIGLGRGVYNTSAPGNSNVGHTYGDQLNAAERSAVLEYLKTL